MISSTYIPCPAIEIWGWKGRAITPPGTVMDMAEFTPFRDRIVSLLERIRKTNSGDKLLRAITATGHRVRIHSADGAEDNAAKMDPNVAASGPLASVVSFRPAHHNVGLALKGNEKAWRGQSPTEDRSTQKANLKAQMVGLGQAVTKAEAAPVLAAVLRRVADGVTLHPQLTNNRYAKPLTQLPQKLGISAAEFAQFYNGQKYIPDAVYYQLCFLLYDYLIPGSGTDAQVRVMTEAMFDHDFKSDLKKESRFGRTDKETRGRLDAAVLAHELIHAWRMMAGRRIVVGGWEEEAMTSGIGPFGGWRLTENSFRRDLGLKSRTSYGSPSHSSELMSGIAQQTNAGTYKGIMF